MGVNGRARCCVTTVILLLRLSMDSLTTETREREREKCAAVLFGNSVFSRPITDSHTSQEGVTRSPKIASNL